MLQVMRSGWLYAFFIGFLLMGGVSLVLMDYGGYYNNAVSSNDIAKAGHVTIKAQQFDQTLKRAAQSQGLSAEQAYQIGLADQLLRIQILEYLLSQEAGNLGIVVSDDQVIAQIRSQLGGLLSSKENASDMVRNFLRTQGQSEKDFIAQSRRQIATSLLRGAIAESIVAPTQDQSADLARAADETRAAEILEFPFTAIKSVKAPDDGLLQDFYEEQKSGLMLPEKRDFIIATLPLERIKNDAKVSEDDIKEAYEELKDENFTLPEIRLLEQSILNDATSAQKLIQALKNGKKMQDSVAALKLPPTAYKGAQGFERKGMPEDIGNLAFAAKTNDVIGPVQSALGFHVLVLKDIQPPRVKDIKDVREQIKKDLLADRNSDQLQNILNEIDDRAGRGEPIKDIARDLDMTTALIQKATSLDPLAAYKDDSRDILEEAFSLAEGEISPAGEMKDGTIYIVGVQSIDQSHPKAFKDVRDDLSKLWVLREQTKIALERAQKITQQVNDKTKTLTQAATENGLNVVRLQSVKRSAKPPMPLDAVAFEKLFSLDQGHAAFVPTKNSLIILTPTSVSIPEKTKIFANLENAAQGQAESVVVLYLNALRDRFGVSINDKLLRHLYAPKKEGAL